MPEDQQNPQPLDYHKPDESERRMGVQTFIGCVVAALIVGGAAFLAGFAGFMTAYGNQANAWPAVAVFCAIILTGIGIVVFWAIRARRNPGWRGLALGLWIGLGIGLLGAGICFGAGILR